MAEPQLQEASQAEILTVPRSEAQKYEQYEKWYKNQDGLFTELGKFVGQLSLASADSRITRASAGAKLRSSVENLRNPVHRIVEFYATTMLTGALEDALPVKVDRDEAEDQEGAGEEPEDKSAEALKAAILEFWEWSNIIQRLRVGKRYLSRDGQVFEQIVLPEHRRYCFKHFIPTKHVTDFDTDDRGNIVFIRIDVPDVKKLEGGQSKKIWQTQIWRKGTTEEGEKQPGYALFAEVERTTEASVPTEKRVEQAEGAKRVALGTEDAEGYEFDFVPFVVINAADTGEKRPDPVYAHGLHLIAWVCREATRLSDLMFRFNKAFKVVFGMGNDASGRPMPPPKPGHVRDLGAIHAEQQNGGGEHTVPFMGNRATMLSREQEDISIEGVAVTGLPGTAQMADATPNINYEAARTWINDHIREVYEELPELLYYAIESRANQSGAALRTLIAGALSRAEEMQGNLIEGLIKGTKMGLTIAQLEGFEGFSEGEIGTFENGDFDFEIEPPEILPLTEEEKERAKQGKLSNAQSLVALLSQLGVSAEEQRRIVLTELGHEELLAKPEDGEATSGAPEGEPTPDELAASQQALAARLRGQQTPTGGRE